MPSCRACLDSSRSAPSATPQPTSGISIAPPYDVLSADDVATLAARSDHNIVHVDVPAGGDDRYERAARILHAWMADGVLVLDDVDVVHDLPDALHRRGGLRS